MSLLVIDLGIVFTVLTVRKIFGERYGLMAAVLCFFNPVVYIFIPFVYTNTFSIAFMMGIFYMFTLLEDERRSEKRLFYLVLEAFFLILGFEIRPTVAIPFIALVIYKIMLYFMTNTKQSCFVKWREAAWFGIWCILFYSVCRVIIYTYVPEELRSANFPLSHWIMMGLQGKGGYLLSDQEYTYGFSTFTDKVEANMEVIHQRLHGLFSSRSSLINFLKEKFLYTWKTDMDGYMVEVGLISSYNPLHKFFSGCGMQWLSGWYFVYKLTMFGLMAVGAVGYLLKNKITKIYPYLLTLFGFFVFYLIWESNFRYTICLTFLFCILAINGLYELQRSICVFEKYIATYNINMFFLKKLFRIICLGIIFLPAIVQMYRKFDDYTEQKNMQSEYIIKSNFRDFHYKNIEDIISNHTVITQSFYSEEPFNEIQIYVFNLDTALQPDLLKGKYCLRIKDGEGKVLAEQRFAADEGVRYFKSIKFDTIYPEEKTQYFAEISAADINGSKDTIGFTYLDFDSYDYLPKADLYVNSVSINRDLCIRVINNYEAVLVSKSTYMIVCIFICIGMGTVALFFLPWNEL